MAKIILTALGLCLFLAESARAGNHPCYWDGREMHCGPGWVWQNGREWREHEWWQEQHRGHTLEHRGPHPYWEPER